MRLDHLRHPQVQAIKRDDDGEIRNHENPDALVGQHLPQAVQRAASVRAASRAAMMRFSSSLSHFALAGPSGSSHKTPSRNSSDGNAFQQDHPLPAMQGLPLKPSSQPEIGAPITLASGTAARNRAMNRARVACGKPVGHVEHHAGIKPGLRRAQQKPQHDRN